MKFNLKGWQKIKDHADHAVLSNKDGHELKIAKKPLSKEMRMSLDALPMKAPEAKEKLSKAGEQKMFGGGRVKPEDTGEKPNKELETNEAACSVRKALGNPCPEPKPVRIDPGYGAGGSVKKTYDDKAAGAYADGGEVETIKTEANQDARNKIAAAFGGGQQEPVKKADGGEISYKDMQKAPQTDQPQQMQPITINVGTPSGAMPAPTMSQAGPHDVVGQGMPAPAPAQAPGMASLEQARAEEPSMAPPAASIEAPGVQATPLLASSPDLSQGAPAQANGVPAGAPKAPGQMDPYAEQERMFRQGYQQQRQGITGEAQALGQLGQQEAATLQNSVERQQAAQASYQQHYGELDKERQAFVQDLQNQHIDPQHYLNSMGTMGKIKTALGLIVGGFGGRNNEASKFLDDQITRDIDAQKMELGKKENLLSANMRQFGNLKDATDMTRVMQMDIVSNMLKGQAAKFQGQISGQRALQQAGQLDQSASAMLGQLAMRKMFMGAMQSGGDVAGTIGMMRMMNPEMAKSMESRYVPGVGLAQVPISEAAREKMIAKANFGERLKVFHDWAAAHSGSLSPADINYGHALAAEIQNMYRNSIDGGVFKAGEQKFIDNIIDSDPTKFYNSIRVLPAIKEVMQGNNAQLSMLYKSYGIQRPQIKEAPPVLRGR